MKKYNEISSAKEVAELRKQIRCLHDEAADLRDEATDCETEADRLESLIVRFEESHQEKKLGIIYQLWEIMSQDWCRFSWTEQRAVDLARDGLDLSKEQEDRLKHLVFMELGLIA